MPANKIDFKDPLWIIAWLRTALDKEKEKYTRCPVVPDVVPGHDVAQGWGFVVAGYFLVEESFKALAHVRGKVATTKHSLTMLFDLFDVGDKDVLREYYADFRATIGGNLARFPFATLDEFLTNLDGDRNRRGDDYVGSFDWRYFLIENERSRQMPSVSVEYLHEVAYGSIQIIKHAYNGPFDPRQNTRSFRLRSSRERAALRWHDTRMNANDDWRHLGDRVEKLWGPDYKGRFDYFVFRGDGGLDYCFGAIPDHLGLPVIDVRGEVALSETTGD